MLKDLAMFVSVQKFGRKEQAGTDLPHDAIATKLIIAQEHHPPHSVRNLEPENGVRQP